MGMKTMQTSGEYKSWSPRVTMWAILTNRFSMATLEIIIAEVAGFGLLGACSELIIKDLILVLSLIDVCKGSFVQRRHA